MTKHVNAEAKRQLSIAMLPTNFRISLDARLRAAAGIPAYIRRKRRIEDLEDAAREALLQVYEQSLSDSGGDEQLARRVTRQRAQAMDVSLLNDLIDRHNRWYPIEANLPTDVSTGRLMSGSKPWEPLAARTGTDFCNV